jgi:hypothetical protein
MVRPLRRGSTINGRVFYNLAHTMKFRGGSSSRYDPRSENQVRKQEDKSIKAYQVVMCIRRTNEIHVVLVKIFQGRTKRSSLLTEYGIVGWLVRLCVETLRLTGSFSTIPCWAAVSDRTRRGSCISSSIRPQAGNTGSSSDQRLCLEL